MNDFEPINNPRQYYNSKDKLHDERIAKLISNAGLSISDVLYHYSSFIKRRDTTRFLAHYELFKLVKDLPGSIAELGVFRGSGTFMWHHFLETFCPGDRNKRVYGFDHFEGYVNSGEDHIKPWIENVLGEMVSSKDFIDELTSIHNQDSFLPGVPRTHIIEGDVLNTVKSFSNENPGLRLSLLYFDIGLFKPTYEGLKHLYPLVVNGGVIAFNGYGMKPWEGESEAVELYFKEIGYKPKFVKFPFSTLPHAYFIKD